MIIRLEAVSFHIYASAEGTQWQPGALLSGQVDSSSLDFMGEEHGRAILSSGCNDYSNLETAG